MATNSDPQRGPGFHELRDDIIGALESTSGAVQALSRYADAIAQTTDRLSNEQAEIRDEINALANRLEALTHFVTTDPAEVAAKIVTDANLALVGQSHTPGATRDCSACGGSGKARGLEAVCSICDGYGKVR